MARAESSVSTVGKWIWPILFSLIVVSVTTLIGGYSFAAGDQVEQLPIVYRAIDPEYLSNDFFVTSAAESQARAGYAYLLAFLADFASVEVLYFLLTVIAKFLIYLVTYLTARDIFWGSDLTGMLAASFVAIIGSFNIGGAAELRFQYLTPSLLVMPLILSAVWAGLRMKIILAVGLTAFASVIHPLLGLETGGLVLLTYFIVTLIQKGGTTLEERRALIIRGALAGLVLLIMTVVWVSIEGSQERLTTSKFFEIIAEFRHPHHYLPSQFTRVEYLYAVFFLFAFGVAWGWWRKQKESPSRLVYGVLAISILVLLACAAGFVFVEVIPIRWFITAQTFRLLLLVKWLGFIVIAGRIATLLESPEKSEVTNAYIAVAGTPSALTMAISHGMQAANKRWGNGSGLLRELLHPGLSALLVTLGLALVISEGVLGYATFSLAMFLILVVSSLMMGLWGERNTVLRYIPALATFGFVLLVFVVPSITELPESSPVLRYRPELRNMALYEGDLVAVGDYVRNETPKDAVFLTPPDLGEFRLVTNRAIVVDFKAFPFQDQAMREWRTRLFDLYGGEPRAKGRFAPAEMLEVYRTIDDATISELAKKYGFEYALLLIETETSLPVVLETDVYRLVEIPSG